MPSVGQINSQGILPGGKEEREIIRRTCTAGFQNESLLCATDDAVSISFLQKYRRGHCHIVTRPTRNPRSQRGVQATKLSVCNRLEAPRQDYRRGLRERDRKNAGGNEPASVMNFTHDHEHAPIYEEYLNPAELAPPTVFFLDKETSPNNQPTNKNKTRDIQAKSPRTRRKRGLPSLRASTLLGSPCPPRPRPLHSPQPPPLPPPPPRASRAWRQAAARGSRLSWRVGALPLLP